MICPAPEASLCFEPRQGVRPERQNSGACPDRPVLFEAQAQTLYQPASSGVCVAVMPPSNVFRVEKVRLSATI